MRDDSRNEDLAGTLNRTIVGWKHLVGEGRLEGEKALNRTIVGWKQDPKSADNAIPPPPLNRTIVGWKRGTGSWSMSPSRL